MDMRKMRVWATVSTQAVRDNYRLIKQRLPAGTEIMAVVKANAYGHGAPEVALALEQAGCPAFAVAGLDEAAQLREAGIRGEVLIIGPCPAACAAVCARLDAAAAVVSREQAEALARELRAAGERLRVHIKLDTGMGRVGFPAAAAAAREDILSVLAMPELEAEGVFTHFADAEADEAFTQAQFDLFLSVVESVEGSWGRRFRLRHCANSGAIANFPAMGLDMARAGLILYGHGEGLARPIQGLRPAMELKARVAAVCGHAPGDTISYGRTYTAQRPMRTAVLAIGYADGLHRALSGKMDVLIRGHRCPQVGRICMDMCMVDVTDLPECRVGDTATICGRDGDEYISFTEQAEKAGTIPYELLCAVSGRVPRIYL